MMQSGNELLFCATTFLDSRRFYPGEVGVDQSCQPKDGGSSMQAALKGFTQSSGGERKLGDNWG